MAIYATPQHEHKLKWIIELIEKEFPGITVYSDEWNYGNNTNLALQVMLSNNEPLRVSFDVRYARFLTPEGFYVQPNSCFVNINGDTEYYIPLDWKSEPYEITESEENKTFIRNKCQSLLMWQKWSEGALIFKTQKLKELNLPIDKVTLGPEL